MELELTNGIVPIPTRDGGFHDRLFLVFISTLIEAIASKGLFNSHTVYYSLHDLVMEHSTSSENILIYGENHVYITVSETRASGLPRARGVND